MTDKYSLDLAFSSTTLRGFDATPAMLTVGYGWTKNVSNGEPWEPDGQKPEKVQPNAIVYFTLYDGQPVPYPDNEPPSITSFEIIFNTIQAGAPATPFVDQSGEPVSNPITVTGSFPFGIEYQGSTGCNVKGFPCVVPPPASVTSDDYYTVNPNIAGITIYECTVQFTVKLVDGTSKTFRVDPKMIVEGG